MNPILTTHVGSLIRPPQLLALLEARQEDRPVDDAGFEETVRRSVAAVARQRAEAEIDIVSDGEFGKKRRLRHCRCSAPGLSPGTRYSGSSIPS